jgi:GxxExxY protein
MHQPAQLSLQQPQVHIRAHHVHSRSRVIGLAIKVHRVLGAGLLEAVYHQCLCWELQHAGLKFRREVPLAVIYEDIRFNQSYFADIIVEQTVLVELKSVERILPVHEAQTLTYLRLSGCQIGLLINFNSVLLKDGLRRFIRRGHRIGAIAAEWRAWPRCREPPREAPFFILCALCVLGGLCVERHYPSAPI